ncbi:hypothetical protein [Rhizobium phage RHph_X2_26]|nr:hypothetical protein [Rhizobium phage RHph_X2_26]
MKIKIEAVHAVGDIVRYTVGAASGLGKVVEVKFNYAHNKFCYYVELQPGDRAALARFYYDEAAGLCRVAWAAKDAKIRAFVDGGLEAV